MKSFKDFCFQLLHNPRNRSCKIMNGLLSLLILISIAIIPLHFVPGFDWAHTSLLAFDKFVVTIFTVEYILRVYSSPSPTKYVLSWWGIIDLAAIIPFYLATFGIIQNPEIFLVLRILRLLKLAKIYEIDHSEVQNQAEKSAHGHFSLMPEEKLEHIVQKHPFIFMVNMVIPISLLTLGLAVVAFFQGEPIAFGFAALFFSLAGIFFIKAWLDFLYDVIYITNKRVCIQNRRIFGITSTDISYESITNIDPDNRGFLQWILGFGKVHIHTAAGGTPCFNGAPKPHHVVKTISTNRQIMMNNLTIKDSSEVVK